MKNVRTTIYLCVIVLLLSACAVTPKNLDNQNQDQDWHFARMAERSDQYQISAAAFVHQSQQAIQPGYAANQLEKGHINQLEAQTFARGDVLNIRIEGLTQFDGLYQITKQGTIELPYAKAIKVEGLTRGALIERLKAQLVNKQWFYKDHINLDLSVVRLASVNVSVTGAVFNAGRVSINNQPAIKQEDQIQQNGGAFSPDRDLVAAIRAAGGIRPDADLGNIYLKRGSYVTRLSLATILHGNGFVETPSLINGDEIFVAATDKENIRLIKPSQITPPGMRVLLSNLTAPALNNAQSAVGADATRLPYGASLLDSAISANCIGGTQSANASRSVVLITRNYGSNEQLVIKRSINQLLANSSNHRVNPYLMPNDGVACYDSRFTNFRDVARGIGELVGPIVLGGLL